MGRTVENVKIEIPMNKSVLNCSLTPNQGKYSFDPVSKLLAWDVGKIDQTKLPNIRGNVNFATGARPEDTHANISVHFSISQLAVSGLKVNRFLKLNDNNTIIRYIHFQIGHVWRKI